MKNIFGSVLCLIAMATLVYSCSPTAPGTKGPTVSDTVGFAHHVVVGEVTEIIRPDPFGDLYNGETYGAMVTVQCTYKGGVLPGRIKIGAAGEVPGLCTALTLEKGGHYVLFLNEKNTKFDSFDQSTRAAPKSNLTAYLGVCDLLMDYPMENGMMLRRKVCPDALNPDTCNNPGDKHQNPIPTPEPTETRSKLQGSSTAKSTSDDGNTASMVTATSVSAILFSYLCYMML